MAVKVEKGRISRSFLFPSYGSLPAKLGFLERCKLLQLGPAPDDENAFSRHPQAKDTDGLEHRSSIHAAFAIISGCRAK